jgi:TonB family protein
VRFDGEDVIHPITDREANGQAAHCIEFDTVRGEKTDNNEICVDAANGTLISEKLGAELIEYSNFFPFAGALMPGKISYSFAGAQKMEVTQTMTGLADASPNVLAAPPNAQMYAICTTFRRPIGLSMPQPNPGSGGSDVDIIVRGDVGIDGAIHAAVVQSSERPDLNARALAQVQQWSFTPAMCNGKPDQHEVALTVHFQGY